MFYLEGGADRFSRHIGHELSNHTGLDSVTQQVDVRCHRRERHIPQTETNLFKEG
jgi:hypothetical protein